MKINTEYVDWWPPNLSHRHWEWVVSGLMRPFWGPGSPHSRFTSLGFEMEEGAGIKNSEMRQTGSNNRQTERDSLLVEWHLAYPQDYISQRAVADKLKCYTLPYPGLPHSCVQLVLHILIFNPWHCLDAAILQMTSKSECITDKLCLCVHLSVVLWCWGLNLISGNYVLPLSYSYP